MAIPGPFAAVSTLPLPALRSDSQGLDYHQLRADLEVVHRCGVTHVDMTDTWLPLEHVDARGIHLLRGIMSDLDLQLCGVSVVGRSIIDPMRGMAALRHSRTAITVAAELGAAVVAIGFRETPPCEQDAAAAAGSANEGYRRDPVALVRSLAEQAATRGISIALELYAGASLASARLAMDVVTRSGMANVGISLNVDSPYRSPLYEHEGPADTIARCLPAALYWRVIDCRREVGQTDAPRAGNAHALRIAKASGYRGPVVVESWRDDGLVAQQAVVAQVKRLLQTPT